MGQRINKIAFSGWVFGYQAYFYDMNHIRWQILRGSSLNIQAISLGYPLP